MNDPQVVINEYVCMSVCKNIYVRAEPYSLDYDGGAMKV